MFFSKIRLLLTHLDLFALGVPASVLVAVSILPQGSFYNQALVGVMLVWCTIQFMTGFPLWH